MTTGVGPVEYVRRIARECLGNDSAIYNLAARFITGSSLLKSEGLKQTLTIHKFGRTATGIKPLRLSRLAHPINVRTGTCDVGAVVDVAVRQEYGIPLPYDFAPRTMIDAGAYIGDTAAYFLSRYPDLFVLALEPNSENFALAQSNLSAYGQRARVVKAALWRESCNLTFHGDFLAGSVDGNGRTDGQEIAALSVLDALELLPDRRADILKMDIEGAEREVLLHSPERWLDRVGNILVEFHGSEITDQVLPVLKRAGFNCTRYRSIWYCSRKQS